MTEQVDLSEYPEGYRGRKAYRYVRSAGMVVAACYTCAVNGVTQLLPEYGGPAIDSKRVGSTYVVPDIGEYTSPVDGSRITTRSQHREHVRHHDLVEVGNQRIGSMGGPQDSGRRAGYDIKQALERARAG